jgi:hypothetical protein
MSTTPAKLVPDDIRGVWQRVLRQSETDSRTPPLTDRESWVRWVQTGTWYGDLCIPKEALLGREARPLAAMAPEQHQALASQQAFVGITQFDASPEGQMCTWLRRLDFQPPGLHPDAGWMLFDKPDQVIEVGAHEDFNEVWQRLPDSTGRFFALAGSDALGRDDGRRLLLAGDYLMLARPRNLRWPRGMVPGQTLADVLRDEPALVLDWLDCEVSFGRLGAQGWCIERSTLPEREGQCLPLHVSLDGEHQAHVNLGAQAGDWQVLEWCCEAQHIRAGLIEPA